MRLLFQTRMAIVVTLLLSSAAAFAYPSANQYRTKETEHFRITYHQGEEELADYVVVLIEDIHKNLSPILDWKPLQKTEVLLVDHTDQSNGFSNVYPYNRVILFMAPPGQGNALNDYDDWLRLLIAHEYTHILQLDTKSGLVAVINKIFGKTLNPNQQTPRWYSEGSAIWSESHLSAGGRNRSSFFEMYLRANFLEGRDLDISDWHAERHKWPYGNTVYLYGMKFLQYMADKTGDDTLAALGYLYGQRVIPYSLNTVMKQVTDTDWLQLYDEWRAQLKSRYEEDRRRLEKIGLSQFELLTSGGPGNGSPLLHPSGSRMAFYLDNGKGRSGWFYLDPQSGKKSLIVQADSNGGADFSPDGHRLVYSQAQTYKREYYYYDLFMHDIDRGETRRITTKKRAQEPDFHPDGGRIAYVSMLPGRSRLEILDLDRGGTMQPIPEQVFEQVYQPRWSPDGKHLAFIARPRFGFKDLFVLDTESNRLENISNDNSQDLTPSWSPDGRFLLWSSDRSGIFNIYAYDVQSGETHQLTNVLTGAFEPQMSADGGSLYFAHYSSDAFDLARMKLDRKSWMKAPVMPDLRPDGGVYEMQPVEYTDREYSPFPSLYPKLWHPTWGEDAKGDTVGITTWGDDLTFRHSWQAEFDYGIESRTPTFGASYTNRVFAPSISMRFANTSYTLKDAALINSKRVDQDESRYSGGISIGFPLSGRENRGRDTWTYSHGVSIGYSYSYTRLLNNYKHTPLENPPIFAENGFMSGLGISWNYNNRRGYPGYVGTSAGRNFYVSVSSQSDILGSDYQNIVASAGYAEFIANPWVDHHVLALRINGGLGVANFRQRRIFYIGGPPERDIVSDIIRDERVFGAYVRGYSPYALAGDKYLLFNSEYRFVVWHIEKGVYTLPLFFRRLHLAPFFDAANVWSDRLKAGETRMGVGGEVRLDVVFGYARPVTIRAGYQVGLNEGGIHGFILALDNLF